ncbi:iron uptake transporter permease EfeU [Chloroflexota bacterium]
MFNTFLITLREGLEAALIIGIVLAFLNQTGERQWFKQVWLGTTAAILVSIIAGLVLFLSVGAFEGKTEKIFEGIAMLTAAGILTWMVFWMRKQAANIKTELHARIKAAIGSGSSIAITGLAFVAVVREGIETVLFLFGATRNADSAVLEVSGGVAGIALAIVIGYGVYKGTSRLNLRTFFNTTGLLLILFAAGLLTHGIHEFQEAGIIPIVVEHLWDINNIFPEKSVFGMFFTAVFGYNGNPSLIEVAAYTGYLATTLILFFKQTKIL